MSNLEQDSLDMAAGDPPVWNPKKAPTEEELDYDRITYSLGCNTFYKEFKVTREGVLIDNKKK